MMSLYDIHKNNYRKGLVQFVGNFMIIFRKLYYLCSMVLSTEKFPRIWEFFSRDTSEVLP